jgi:protein-S-isoprenylcysteine O-methyltransferase Ste14
MTDAPSKSAFLSRGGAWVISQSILMTAVVGLGVIFRGDWTRLTVIFAGVALFVIGGYFGIAGVAVLSRNRTPFPKPRAGSDLVKRGIYAHVRHPLYQRHAGIDWLGANLAKQPGSLRILDFDSVLPR